MVSLINKSKAPYKYPAPSSLHANKTFFQAEPASPQAQYTELERELVVAEYNALMTELNNRQNIRYQMVQLSLAALGALLTVSSAGIQSHLDSLILVYPVLVLPLSIIFIVNSIEASRIKDYIKKSIEVQMPKIDGKPSGWQHRRNKGVIERIVQGTLGNAGSKFVFILTAFFAVGIGWQMMTHNQVNDILFRVGLGAAIILTLLLSIHTFYRLAKLAIKLLHIHLFR